jgi:hypothetical protein
MITCSIIRLYPYLVTLSFIILYDKQCGHMFFNLILLMRLLTMLSVLFGLYLPSPFHI